MGVEWHYAKGNQRLGPISTEELKAMAQEGRLSPDDMIWKKGMAAWTPANSTKGLFPSTAEPPPLPRHEEGPPPLPPSGPGPMGSSAQAGSRGDQGRPRSRRGPARNRAPTEKKGLDAVPVWARALIGAAIGTFFLATRFDCDSGSSQPGGAGPWRPGGAQHSTSQSLPSGVTDAELWAQVQRTYPNASHQEQLAMYQMLLNARIQQERQRAIRRMYSP